jgi:predicted nucleic acid-binding protein
LRLDAHASGGECRPIGSLVFGWTAGRLDLLPALFREVWIPRAVHREVATDGLGRVGAAALSQAAWVARVVDAPEPDPLLVAELDRGEAEVIALANSSRPCLAIIDEKRGRRIAARVYQLPLKGTAGILVEAHRRGLLDDLRATLDGLKREGYFLADAVIDAACKAAETI